MQQKSLAVPIALLLGILIIGGAIYFAFGRSIGADADKEQVVDKAQDISLRPVSEDDHILGNPNAPVVIVEYADLECVFCKDFHLTMKRLMDEFGREGKIAWVFRHFPIADLHSQAPTEALAAECVGKLGGNTTFWAFVDSVYEVTDGNNTLDLALLPGIATGVGVDESEFQACMNDGSLMANIERDFDDALTAGGTGTPHIVFVTDTEAVPVRGAQPYIAMRSILQTIFQQKTGETLTRPSQVQQNNASPFSNSNSSQSTSGSTTTAE